MTYTRPIPDGGGNNVLQINPDDLVITYPHFYTASDKIRDAATNLNNVLTTATSAFDGDTQKKLQELGNSCVTNLKGLADALSTIASRLEQTANASSSVEHGNMRMF